MISSLRYLFMVLYIQTSEVFHLMGVDKHVHENLKFQNRYNFYQKLSYTVIRLLQYIRSGIISRQILIPYGEGNGNPLQYSCLANPMDGGAWQAAVHGVAKSRTRLSDFTFTFHFHALEREMATHFSVIAWRIPGTGEPGGLPSLGSHRVGHD